MNNSSVMSNLEYEPDYFFKSQIYLRQFTALNTEKYLKIFTELILCVTNWSNFERRLMK